VLVDQAEQRARRGPRRDEDEQVYTMTRPERVGRGHLHGEFAVVTGAACTRRSVEQESL